MKRLTIQLCALVTAVLLLSACQRVYLRDGMVVNRFPLQESASYTATNACLQNLELQLGEESSYYQVVYDATLDVHQLVVLSAIGQRLVTVLQRGSEVSIQKSLPIPLAFSPRELLLSMQLIYWPVSVLESGIQQSEWQIIADNSARYVYKGDKLLATIDYQEFHECRGTIDYSLASGRMLHIESVSF
jgi:hypothetical protein